ncbi:hypothetical protein IFM12276_25710 [Nocardia sputorum]|uniref:Thioester reductase (TE) domain-containing protein n=2 Tax=Nocardia sputorum TaxID=2984338 RepID=A0ABM8CX13_9NOCA|nr:hypothetical protein IFM12276_25710 [Nocardia sputorum]
MASRIVPVVGDLEQDRFGLSERLFRVLSRSDAVLHNGARVNHVEPYARLRGANVAGTRTVLRLALQGQGVPVHFISTTSVALADGRVPRAPVSESARPMASELRAGGRQVRRAGRRSQLLP